MRILIYLIEKNNKFSAIKSPKSPKIRKLEKINIFRFKFTENKRI